MFRFLLIFFCLFLLSSQAEERLVIAPFMSESVVGKKSDKLKEKKKEKPLAESLSKDKPKKNFQEKNLGQRSTSEEDYSPSLLESLNDSNHLKNKIKRQLSGDDLTQTDRAKNPTENEVANFW